MLTAIYNTVQRNVTDIDDKLQLKCRTIDEVESLEDSLEDPDFRQKLVLLHFNFYVFKTV
jgi:cysteinyl-tRNA synthetase